MSVVSRSYSAPVVSLIGGRLCELENWLHTSTKISLRPDDSTTTLQKKKHTQKPSVQSSSCIRVQMTLYFILCTFKKYLWVPFTHQQMLQSSNRLLKLQSDYPVMLFVTGFHALNRKQAEQLIVKCRCENDNLKLRHPTQHLWAHHYVCVCVCVCDQTCSSPDVAAAELQSALDVWWDTVETFRNIL